MKTISFKLFDGKYNNEVVYLNRHLICEVSDAKPYTNATYNTTKIVMANGNVFIVTEDIHEVLSQINR